MSSDCSMAHEREREREWGQRHWSVNVPNGARLLPATGLHWLYEECLLGRSTAPWGTWSCWTGVTVSPAPTHPHRSGPVSRDWSERICLFHARRMRPNHRLIRHWESVCAWVHLILVSFQFLIWLAGNHHHPSSSSTEALTINCQEGSLFTQLLAFIPESCQLNQLANRLDKNWFYSN